VGPVPCGAPVVPVPRSESDPAPVSPGESVPVPRSGSEQVWGPPGESVPVPRSGPDPAWGPPGEPDLAMAPPIPPGSMPPSPAIAPPGGATAPPRRTHRWGIGAYVVVEAVFVGVSLLIGFAFLGKPVSVTALTVALAVPTVLAAGVAMLITRLRGNGPRTDLGLIWSWHDVRVGIVYGVCGLVITIPASLLYVVLVGPEQASSAVGDVFEGLRAGPVAALTVVLVVVVLAPLCEEIVYRGLLWGALERYALPRWVPFVVTTLLFAVAHFEFTRTPLLFIVALPIALARLRTGRLAASVVAHQVNNLLPGVVLALALVGVLPT
jgi:uncharacterized protein